MTKEMNEDSVKALNDDERREQIMDWNSEWNHERYLNIEQEDGRVHIMSSPQGCAPESNDWTWRWAPHNPLTGSNPLNGLDHADAKALEADVKAVFAEVGDWRDVTEEDIQHLVDRFFVTGAKNIRRLTGKVLGDYID
jgi:hypothetical protein